MSTLSQFVLHLVFVSTFAFFFIMAIILVKPLRFHQTRKVSTAMLKFSYLVYLFIFLLYIYLFLFYQEMPVNGDKPDESAAFRYEYLLLLLAFLIPSFGMLLRRRAKGWRTQYNYIFSAVNILISFYIVLQLFVTDWSFS